MSERIPVIPAQVPPVDSEAASAAGATPTPRPARKRRPSSMWALTLSRRNAYHRSMIKGLNLTPAERAAHINGMRRIVCSEDTREIHAWLHGNLSILDAKAQSILAVYSIALTALTILFTELAATAPWPILLLMLAAFALIGVAIVPLARIAFVYWSTTDEFDEPDEMLADLLRVRDQRTQIVRRAVVQGGFVIAAFAILLAWEALRRL